VLEVLYRHAKFGGVWISPPPGRPKTLSFLCLFVTLLDVKDCAPDFAMKALEYRNNFDAVGYVHPCSTFSHCCQLATPLNARQKNGKN